MERREREREREGRGGGKVPPWLEIVNAENPTVVVAGPLSEARIIVLIVWWSQPHDKVPQCCDIFTTTTGNGRKLRDDGVQALLSSSYCLESPVLNYLFEQIIVVEDKLKEEVESEKNF